MKLHCTVQDKKEGDQRRRSERRQKKISFILLIFKYLSTYNKEVEYEYIIK